MRPIKIIHKSLKLSFVVNQLIGVVIMNENDYLLDKTIFPRKISGIQLPLTNGTQHWKKIKINNKWRKKVRQALFGGQPMRIKNAAEIEATSHRNFVSDQW